MIYDAEVAANGDAASVVLFSCSKTDYEQERWERALIYDKLEMKFSTTSWDLGGEEYEARPPEWVTRLFETVLPRLESMALSGEPKHIARFV